VNPIQVKPAFIEVRPAIDLKVGRVLGLNPAEMARVVLIPAVLPEIMTGLRLGFSLCLIGTILGEMFAARRGLGYLLMTAIGLHDVDLIGADIDVDGVRGLRQRGAADDRPEAAAAAVGRDQAVAGLRNRNVNRLRPSTRSWRMSWQ
jgi:hypothetical protein